MQMDGGRSGFSFFFFFFFWFIPFVKNYKKNRGKKSISRALEQNIHDFCRIFAFFLFFSSVAHQFLYFFSLNHQFFAEILRISTETDFSLYLFYFGETRISVSDSVFNSITTAIKKNEGNKLFRIKFLVFFVFLEYFFLIEFRMNVLDSNSIEKT